MKKRLLPALLVLAMALAMLPMAAYAIDEVDYQTALIAQLETGVRPSANNLFLGLSQWKKMKDGPEKSALAERYAAITALDLSSMGLTQKSTSDDLSMLEPFTGLEELDLSTTSNTPGGSKNTLTNLDYLQNFPNLRRLDASGNQLEAKSGTAGGISGLADCEKLEALDLSGNKSLGSSDSVSDAMAVLARLPKIRELNLSNTAFSDSDVQSVLDMPSLRTLDISDTPVKDLDLSSMTHLTSLTAKNLTLDSLSLPKNLTELDFTGTKLKVRSQNVDEALRAANNYGDSGLKLVDGSRPGQEVYAVTVADTVNGTAKASVRTAAGGTTVSISATPVKGWARDSIVVSYIDEDGEPASVTVSGSEFIMPDGDVTVTVTFMPQNIEFEYNVRDKGSVSLDREAPARGERVSFVTKLSRGYQVREITARIGSRPLPVYRDSDGTYCFDMPRFKEDETLTFSVSIVEIVTPSYKRSGASVGQLTLSGLIKNQQYVCQLSEAEAEDETDAYTIVTFTAQDSTEQLEVRAAAGGYIVSLWKYDDEAASVQDLTNVFYEIIAK